MKPFSAPSDVGYGQKVSKDCPNLSFALDGDCTYVEAMEKIHWFKVKAEKYLENDMLEKRKEELRIATAFDVFLKSCSNPVVDEMAGISELGLNIPAELFQSRDFISKSEAVKLYREAVLLLSKEVRVEAEFEAKKSKEAQDLKEKAASRNPRDTFKEAVWQAMESKPHQNRKVSDSHVGWREDIIASAAGAMTPVLEEVKGKSFQGEGTPKTQPTQPNPKRRFTKSELSQRKLQKNWFAPAGQGHPMYKGKGKTVGRVWTKGKGQKGQGKGSNGKAGKGKNSEVGKYNPSTLGMMKIYPTQKGKGKPKGKGKIKEGKGFGNSKGGKGKAKHGKNKPW